MNVGLAIDNKYIDYDNTHKVINDIHLKSYNVILNTTLGIAMDWYIRLRTEMDH